VDIGAYSGLYTLCFGAVGHEGRVIALSHRLSRRRLNGIVAESLQQCSDREYGHRRKEAKKSFLVSV